MTQGRRHVGVNLSPDQLEPATECVILREVPPIDRIDHTIEYCAVIIQILILVIVDALETPGTLVVILFEHILEHLAFYAHESGRSIEHLDKPVDNLRLSVLEVHHECTRQLFYVTDIVAQDGSFGLVPHDHLLGVARDRDVVPRFDESDDRFGFEMDIGIDKHEMGTIRLVKKPSDRDVSGSGNQGFILGSIVHELDPLYGTESLETEHRFGILLKTEPTVAGSADAQSDPAHFLSTKLNV